MGKKGLILKEWQPYIEDVAFQMLVMRRAFPELKVVPYLMLPNRQRRTNIEGLYGQFRIEVVPPAPGSRFRHYQVDFRGDPDPLRAEELLVKGNRSTVPHR